MAPIQALADRAKAAERPQVVSAPNISAMRNWRDSEQPQPSDARPEGSRPSGDLLRLSAARGGEPLRIAEFIKHISPTVWKSCCVLTDEGVEARAAFAEVMAALSANRFARLGGYSGRGTLQTFVALTVRELLAERMLRLLHAAPERGWTAFERLFRPDIQRVIHKRFPNSAEETRRDLYQDICLSLIDDEYRRLKSYNGSGSFAGFVLRTVDHLVIDTLRDEVRRRRLTADVIKLPALEQEIFKLVHWQGIADRPEVLAPHLAARLKGGHDPAEIAAALMRVRGLAPPAVTARIASLSAVNADNVAGPEELSPEAQILRAERESRLDAALEAMNGAVDALSGSERLYLTIVLSAAETPPSREIARLMRRPVEEIYKLRQRVLQRLRDVLSKNPTIKNWRASV